MSLLRIIKIVSIVTISAVSFHLLAEGNIKTDESERFVLASDNWDTLYAEKRQWEGKEYINFEMCQDERSCSPIGAAEGYDLSELQKALMLVNMRDGNRVKGKIMKMAAILSIAIPIGVFLERITLRTQIIPVWLIPTSFTTLFLSGALGTGWYAKLNKRDLDSLLVKELSVWKKSPRKLGRLIEEAINVVQ